MYSEFYNLLAYEFGLAEGFCGTLLCDFISTLMCLSVVAVPFICVFWIIRRCVGR